MLFLPIRSLSSKWNWCWCWPTSSVFLPFKRLQLWNSHQRVISIASLVKLMCAQKFNRMKINNKTCEQFRSLERATTPRTKTKNKNKSASKSENVMEIWIQNAGCAWITCYTLMHWNIAMKLYVKCLRSALLHVSSSFARCFITERKSSGKMWHCRLITNQ